MDGNLVHFGEDLSLHLCRLRESLNNISGMFAPGPTEAVEIAPRLQELQASMEDSSRRAALLYDALQGGLERAAALTPEIMAGWVGARQTAQLHSRADLIEQLATMAVELAALNALQAERITMTAMVARREAIAVQIQYAAQP